MKGDEGMTRRKEMRKEGERRKEVKKVKGGMKGDEGMKRRKEMRKEGEGRKVKEGR